MTDWIKLTEVCRKAMKLAAVKPGRYGGRYVGRRYDRKTKSDVFEVLDDDDPKRPGLIGKDFDVLAQVTPTKVFPIGGAHGYLREDGSVSFDD